MYDLYSKEHMLLIGEAIDMTFNGVYKMKKNFPDRYLMIAKGVYVEDVDFDSLTTIVDATRDILYKQKQKTLRELLDVNNT